MSTNFNPNSDFFPIPEIIVMSPEDVAAMRATAKAIEAQYFDAKVAALRAILDEMKRTGKSYTAAELSRLSGLSVGEVCTQLRYWRYCKASVQAGIGRKDIEIARKPVERHYVEVDENGELIPENTLVIKHNVTVYSAK